MRKLFVVFGMVIICILIAGAVAAASGDDSTHSPNFLLNLYQVEDSLAVGLQPRLLGNFYGAADNGYWNSLQDLRVHAGVVYFIPREVLVFKFYSGAGYQFSRDNSSNNYPYLLAGTRFLFFFSEALYPLARQTKPEYRVGLSLDFSKSDRKTSSSTGEVAETRSFRKDYDLAPNIKSIKIENEFGEVEVRSGAEGVVSMTADIAIRAARQKELNLYRNDFKINGKSQDDVFIIKTQAPNSKYNLPVPQVAVKMLVYVPDGITVYVNGKEVEPFESISY